MGNFFAWTLVYALKLLFVAAFSAIGIAIGISLRKMKNRQRNDNQEAK